MPSNKTTSASQPLLSVRHLKQYFPIPGGSVVKAVDDISFDIMPGETFGLVGESGSGKSTTGRAIIKLDPITSGTITFDGDDISGRVTGEVEKRMRTNMSMVFQDPMASLNPYRKVSDTIATGLDAHFPRMDRKERMEHVYQMMDRVGLSRSQANRYPSQFSGGQRQRVGLARALIMNPKLIIADEAISALDVSIQAQVVNLMRDIQQESGAAYLFIAHDLSMVRYISDHIAVMHLGHVVEQGATDQVFSNPVHPYTKSLISAIPRVNPETERDRKPMVYDAKSLGIDYTAGTYHQVEAGHEVLGTQEELERWV
jgi:oligopeptide transport system ATP-binding protein